MLLAFMLLAPLAVAQPVSTVDRFASGALDAPAFAEAVVARTAGGTLRPVAGDTSALARAASALHVLIGEPATAGSAPAAIEVSARRLVAADRVLQRGALSVLAAVGDVVAFERTLAGERRVIAFSRAAVSRLLTLPRVEGRAPAPFTPVFASSGEAADVPALVAILDEGGALTYGLRLPPQTVVVFRPVAPSDVRPRGLDE